MIEGGAGEGGCFTRRCIAGCPNTPCGLLGPRSFERLGCNLSRRINREAIVLSNLWGRSDSMKARGLAGFVLGDIGQGMCMQTEPIERGERGEITATKEVQHMYSDEEGEWWWQNETCPPGVCRVTATLLVSNFSHLPACTEAFRCAEFKRTPESDV